MYKNNNFLNKNTVVTNPNNIARQQYLSELDKQKEHQRIRQLEKYNKMLNNIDQRELKKMVFDHAFTNNNTHTKKKNIEVEYNNVINKLAPTREKYWKERTNAPYKIISGSEHFKKFYKKDTKNVDDLIIHKIIPANEKEAEKKFIACKNKREDDNNELRIIYSNKKKPEHEKKFQYIHVFKQRSYNPSSSHTDMKKSKSKYYKKEKSEMENNKKKMDNILNALINDGILNESEIEHINNEKTQKTIPITKTNSELPNKMTTPQPPTSKNINISPVRQKTIITTRRRARVIGENRIRINTRKTVNMNTRRQPCKRSGG